ncbi:MAG TPA: FAD-dependent oxidoreductase, partial [Methylomirabilota bacterium]|nr:FAD-dependent oxidoreductase [Methylomirabilota bacterium]
MRAPDRSVDVLLIGGGVASVRCARTLRRRGFDGSILIAGGEPRPPYNRPPLSKQLLRDDLPDELVDAEPAGWYERHSVDLLTDATIVALDPDVRRVTLSEGGTLAFGRCLLATGASPRAVPVPGGELALLLRTLPDAHRLRRAALAAGAGAPAVIVGGGLIGVEVASGLAALGLRPTVVELGRTAWGGSLGSALGTWAVERLRAAGVDVRLSSAVTRLEADAALVGEERLPAAFVVAGVGVRPRDELAAGAGLAVDDGVLVDSGHRTSHPAVWAAGDVARVEGRRVEHWHAAREGGERAALSMLGLDLPPRRVPWLFTEVAGIALDLFGTSDAWDEERWLGDHAALA